MPIKPVDLLIFWLPIVGGILLGSVAVSQWFSGSKAAAIWTGFFGVICFLLVGAIQLSQIVTPSSQALAEPAPAGGGAGGNAKVGGSGIAVGGQGGRVFGPAGIGGQGGSAEVSGDGIAAGGAGGSVGSEDYWPAPAKSGYELAQKARGLAVDPELRAYGRGGAVAGYEPKLAVVEKLREEYFRVQGKKSQSIFQNINAMPLDALNNELAKSGHLWRAHIVDDEYEFFIPK